MNERIWDKFLTGRDKAVLRQAGTAPVLGLAGGRRCG